MIWTSICVTSPTSTHSSENISTDPGLKPFFFSSNSRNCLPLCLFLVPIILINTLLSVPIFFSLPVVIFTVYGIAVIKKTRDCHSPLIAMHATTHVHKNIIAYDGVVWFSVSGSSQHPVHPPTGYNGSVVRDGLSAIVSIDSLMVWCQLTRTRYISPFKRNIREEELRAEFKVSDTMRCNYWRLWTIVSIITKLTNSKLNFICFYLVTSPNGMKSAMNWIILGPSGMSSMDRWRRATRGLFPNGSELSIESMLAIEVIPLECIVLVLFISPV